MLIKTSYKKGINSASSTLYGELVLDLNENRLYTLNLNNNSLKADYPRKVIEFRDFKPTEFKDGYILSISTALNSTDFVLSSLPFLSINILGGTDIPEDTGTNRLNKYLAFNSDGKLVIDDRPEFSLFDLGDVLSLTESQKQERDGEVLTYIADPIESTKDYYINVYPGYWALRPELKSVRLAGDVRYTPNTVFPISNYRILRQTTRSEFQSTNRLLITDTLSIGADSSPALSDNLKYGVHSSYNEQYSYALTFLTDIPPEEDSEEEEEPTPLINASIAVDFSKQIVRVTNLPQTTETVTVVISNIPTNSELLKTAVLDIDNFEGVVLFTSATSSARIVYENGITEMAGGKRNIFNIFASFSEITITHKAINVLKTNRYFYE